MEETEAAAVIEVVAETAFTAAVGVEVTVIADALEDDETSAETVLD